MPQISVLLPVYNVAPYVAEALQSLQQQTFADFEIVVVDDGSTDGTQSIVERIAKSEPRIRMVRTPQNLGLPSALNLGLPYCCAPYIARMDGDDVAMPERLEKQLRFLEAHPDIALVGSATIAIDEHSNAISGLSISRRPATQAEVEQTLLLSSPCLHIWMARSEVYGELDGYRMMDCAEDYDFLLRAVFAGYRVSNLQEPLMRIRTRGGNLSSRLEQRKAHEYIAGLYRERLKTGRDSFTRAKYRQATSVGRVEGMLFNFATRMVHAGLKVQSRFVRVLLLGCAVLASPWQARYFINRLRFRVAMYAAGDGQSRKGTVARPAGETR